MGVEGQTGHAGLNVTDLARSVRFYNEIFGLQVLKELDAAVEGDGHDLISERVVVHSVTSRRRSTTDSRFRPWYSSS
jgi:catechol 2,3-dioxygenase-like lactoylglutathione lyase family enzyme